MALKWNTLTAVATVTAGTRKALSATDVYAYAIRIQASKANTGKIYVGDSTVSSSNGQELEAGESIVLNNFERPNNLLELNLADLYIDSSVNAEGVRIAYIKERA